MATNGIRQIITAATTGVQSLLGNMIAKNETDELKAFYSLYIWGVHTICTVLFTITGIMIVPFAQVYTSGITDANYSLPLFGLLLTIAYFFNSLRNCQFILIRAAGHFQKTQSAVLMESILNLFISVALVFSLGLTGVAIGTITATVFFVAYEMIYFSKNIVFFPVAHAIKQFSVDLLVVGLTVLIATQINLFTGSVSSWILQAFVVSIVCFAIGLFAQIVFYRNNLGRILKRFITRR